MRNILTIWPGLFRIVTILCCLFCAFLAGVVAERGGNFAAMVAEFVWGGR